MQRTPIHDQLLAALVLDPTGPRSKEFVRLARTTRKVAGFTDEQIIDSMIRVLQGMGSKETQ